MEQWLEKIAEEAFNDELEKLSVKKLIGKGIKKAKSMPKRLREMVGKEELVDAKMPWNRQDYLEYLGSKVKGKKGDF